MTNHTEFMKDGIIVVTGASEGLGRALSMALVAKGLHVAGISRRIDALKNLEKTLDQGLFLPVCADVSSPEVVAAAFSEIRATGRPVTGLINNAAVYPHRDILDETAESFMQTVAINLGGPLFCAQEALKDMTSQGFGRIVNIGSYADIAPAPVSAAYSVSKGAARILTRALIADLAERFPDIVINDWMPGVLNTKMGLQEGLNPADVAQWGAKLVLWHDRALMGLVFEQDRSVLPHTSFKRRLFMKLTRQQPEQFFLR
jgi:NAD(P)-dependent dehydrogenase (short-subunit alcohol dehydrogenase family)